MTCRFARPIFICDEIFNQQSESGEQNWLQTPFSTVSNGAENWQKAILNGLSTQLDLSGEARLQTAFDAQKSLNARLSKADDKNDDFDDFGVIQLDEKAIEKQFNALEDELLRRFPSLNNAKSPNYSADKARAIAFLKTRPAQVESLYRAYRIYGNAQEIAETREAKLWRFLRIAHTIILQKRLEKEGSDAQKAVFARLRASENRNFLN